MALEKYHKNSTSFKSTYEQTSKQELWFDLLSYRTKTLKNHGLNKRTEKWKITLYLSSTSSL